MSTHTSYIGVREVMLDAAQAVFDDEMRALGEPFYRSQAQQGVTELAYDSGFQQKAYEIALDETLKVELPKDIASIVNVYLFNGDNCDYAQSHVVHWKRNFHHKGGSGYTAQQKWRNDDPLIPNTGFTPSPDDLLAGPDKLYYYGIQHGMMMLSSNCADYQKIRIEYDGIGVKFGDDPAIPMFARQALTDYVIYRAARKRLPDNPGLFRSVMNDALSQLESPRGSWIKARTRVGRMDKAQREDMNSYLTRLSNRP